MAWSAPVKVNGWTVFTASDATAPSGLTTQKFYVSDSTGSNANGGLSSATPKKTLNNVMEFTLSGAGPYSAAEGAIYSNNGASWYVMESISGVTSGAILKCITTGGTPTASGTLTYTGGIGTGTASITFSSRSATVGAVSLLSGSKPDWLMIKRGDTFRNQTFEVNYTDNFFGADGVSNNEKMLLCAYDPANPTVVNPATGGNRPIIMAPYGLSVLSGQGSALANHLGVIGLDLYNYTADPNVGVVNVTNALGISMASAITSFYAEDTMIRYFGGDAIYLNGLGGATSTNAFYRCQAFHNYSQGYHGANGNYAGGGGGTFTMEECLIDANGYYLEYKGTCTFNATTNLVTYVNGWVQTPGAIAVTFSTSTGGVSNATTYFVWNNNGTTFSLSLSNAVDTGVDLTANVSNVIQSLTFRPPSGFNHNYYGGGNTVAGDYNSDSGLITLTGSIVSRDSSNMQMRGYSTTYNNSFLIGPAVAAQGVIKQTHTATLSYNTLIDFRGNPVGGTSGWDIMGASRNGGHTDDSAQGTVNVHHNIATNWVDKGPFIQFGTNVNNGHAYNNIAYKSTTNNTAFPTGDIVHWAGSGVVSRSGVTPIQAVPTANITAGSGYTIISSNIVSEHASSRGFHNYIVLNISNLAGDLGVGTGNCALWIEGTVGFTGLNNKLWKVLANSADGLNTGTTNAITLYNSDGVTGAWSSGGKVYFAYQGFDAGGCQFMAYPGSTGGIAAVFLGGAEFSSPDMTNFGGAGSGYSVGSTVTGSFGGGSGFSFTAPAVGSASDDGGNICDFDGTGVIGSNPGTYPHPERTAGTYYNYLFGGTGATTEDFIAAAYANNKANWNDLLMAASLNDYIRQGLGQAMVGSAYATSQGSVTPPTLMAQICM